MTTSPPVCDNRSVGVLVRDDADRFAIFDRNTFPVGAAPVAGHVDDHGSAKDAAHAEVREELGMNVARFYPLLGNQWADNACRRQPGPLGTGHTWDIFLAVTNGKVRDELKASERETRNARWADLDELKVLAGRTAVLAQAYQSEPPAQFADSVERFAQAPGLEPIWCRWLNAADFIRVHPADLVAIEQLARLGPADWPQASPAGTVHSAQDRIDQAEGLSAQ